MPRALKNDRVDLRLTPETKKTIEKAAMISGQSLTDFVVAATTERAREVNRESDAITLSERDRERVLAALDNPPQPSPALKRAAARYKKTFQ
jgi:uncharacterized protein (DUF1778 family)